jgi:hypothetical protein
MDLPWTSVLMSSEPEACRRKVTTEGVAGVNDGRRRDGPAGAGVVVGEIG